MTLPAKQFYMIRHGQSVGNRDGYFTGSMDVALTEEGIAQAEAAHDALMKSEHRPSIIFHSALSRARHTAEIINKTLKLEMIEMANLNEQHFGNWEGKSVTHFREFYLSGKNPENGESFSDFYKRAKHALTDVLNKHENPMIVCHGGIFRAFHSLYQQETLKTPNAVTHYFMPSEAEEFPWNIGKL